MNGCDTLESIREINLSYLSLVQRMLNDDRTAGMASLGLSAPLAEVLSGLSQAQTLKLASCDQLVCFFRFNDQAMLGTLGAPGEAAVSVADKARLVAQAN